MSDAGDSPSNVSRRDLNQEANRRIAEEVGEDNGHFLPIRDGKWHFPPAADR